MIFVKLFLTFFKIGLFTFGGGYAMLPLIQQEVAANNWMAMEDLINFVAVSESTPGPFAINISTYVGSVLAGIPGAFFATLGVVLPSFIVILLVAQCYKAFQTSPIVKGIMSGLKPAVVGLIGAAIISVGENVFFPNGTVFGMPLIASIEIFLCALLCLKKKVNPILIILLSAALGILCGCLGIL